MLPKFNPVRRQRVAGRMVRGCSGLLLALVVVLGTTNSATAQGPFYALIVNGSTNLNVSYDSGYLTVRFRRTLKPAGSPAAYVKNVPPGAGAWPDRPLNVQEPAMLKQKMSAQEAQAAIGRLRQNGGYWKFYCRNTGQGYFEVLRSEATYASVRID